MSDTRTHWHDVADQWTVWARTPGHDAFWYYREALRDFVGSGTGRALEIGCGEGRVSRELTSLGYRVTALDAVPALIEAAREADSAEDYRVADATELPFDAGTFDLVVSYNMLMDVPDSDTVVAEMSRVLAPAGRAVVSVVHPFVDLGRFAGDDPSAPLVLDADYFQQQHFSGEIVRDGLPMRWNGWSRPLRDYTASFTAHGLAITELTEPEPRGVEDSGDMARWSRLPQFLWLTLRHR